MSHSGKALIDPYPLFKKIGLAAGWRVADLGCGRTGHFVFPASRAVGEHGIVYAVDIVKDILHSIASRAKSERFENVHPVWSNLELLGKTAIPTNSLDACFMVNVLCFLKDKAAGLAEAARVLKIGGRLVIVDWAKPLGLLGPSAAQKVDPGEAVRLAGAALKEDSRGAAGDYHWYLILKKV